jgi:hypothetical protein
MKDAENQEYGEEEAEQRFLAAVKAALNTPPKPLKDRPGKGKESKGGARQTRGGGIGRK